MHEPDLSLAVFDYPTLLERAGDDEALAVEVLNDLKSCAPKDLAALAAAFDAKDAAKAARTAHKLKGALLAVSANRAAARASEVERLARTDLPAAELEAAHLARAWSEACAAVDVVVQRAEKGEVA